MIVGPDTFTVQCLIFELFEKIYKKNVFDKCDVALEWSTTQVAQTAMLVFV